MLGHGLHCTSRLSKRQTCQIFGKKTLASGAKPCDNRLMQNYTAKPRQWILSVGELTQAWTETGAGANAFTQVTHHPLRKV